MPSNDHNEYPRGVYHTRTLSSSLVPVPTVAPTGLSLKISHMILRGGAAEEEVWFDYRDGSTNYFKTTLAIGENVVLRQGWEATNGLSIRTASVAGDVEVTVFYVVP
jgi:hypothetical protein